MDEVKKHKMNSDAWTVIDGIVYDMTKFVPVHPGGKKIMLGAGKESSVMFCKFFRLFCQILANFVDKICLTFLLL